MLRKTAPFTTSEESKLLNRFYCCDGLSIPSPYFSKAL